MTEQQKLFINEYIKLRCKNATQAAINAGYSPKTAQPQSSQLLMKPNVLQYMKKRKSEMVKGVQEEFAYDALEARRVMYDILKNEGSSDKDRITVARDFLDRAGYTPTNKIEHSGDGFNPYAGLTTEELRRIANAVHDDD